MNKNRKILVDLLSYTGNKGGTDVYIRKLYEEIGRLPHNFLFFAIAPKEAKAIDMSWFPGSITYTNLSGDNKITWPIGEIFLVNRVADKIKPDLIHCPANFGPLRSKFKVVLTLHDAIYWAKPKLVPNRVLLLGVRFMQKFTSRLSKIIITDSISSAKDIEKHLKIPQHRIVPIYLGVEFLKVRGHTSKCDKPYFLAGGNRFRHKNWENLLKAFDMIEPQQRPFLTITGGGPEDPLLELVEKYSLSNYVNLLNWVSSDELEKLYLNATAVVIPSYFEGFSLGALQALAARKPLIASSIPVHLELADQIGFFFDPSSPSSIAKALIEFNQEEVNLEARLEKGEMKSKLFTWEKCAIETLAVFNRI
jgi:alpha-1,3-rhamnosyl/mannosyltransferase